MGSRFAFCMIGILALVVTLSSREALADRLELIQKRGTLIVGVKSDYPPFGMLNANGQLVGFEPDLAAELARRLGVGLQLVAVTTTNRLQKLEEGAIDVVIATLGDTPQRRQVAILIEPSYYASGVTVLAPPNTHLSSWADLRGKKVCATQGSYFNRAMAQRYLLDLQVFNGTRDTKLALRDGRCVGWIYDDTAIVEILHDPEWVGYETPLPATMILPWAMAIAASEHGSRLERAISDAIAAWHRSDWLLETEQRWHIKPSRFLSDLHVLWTRTGTDGRAICTRLVNGEWPAECRNKSLLTSTEVGGLQRIGLLLKEQTDLNLTLIYDAYDRNAFFHGLWVTLQLVAMCIAGSLAVGGLGALLAESGIPFLRSIVWIGATLGRMTPPLLLIYMVFFGIGRIIVTRFGWTFDGFVVVTLCLSFYTGCANIFALLEASAVLKQQQSGFTLSWRSLPHALRLAYTPTVAALVNVVKATGMASVIAVPELISISTAIIAEQGNAEVMMNVLMLTYFLLVLFIVRIFAAIERRLLQHDAR
ncbi:MAG: transporter substrate-binding domain-containing protein [Candidatus Competibacteraceae bacterium]